MDFSFESGDPQQPRGHALLYFLDRSDPPKVYASYIIVLPITVDFSKYIPPFLASHIGNMPMSDCSAFSLPPMPRMREPSPTCSAWRIFAGMTCCSPERSPRPTCQT